MSSAAPDGRWDVPSPEALRRLSAEPLPLGVRATAPSRGFLRDVYYDTPDSALRAKGVTCRVQHRSDDRRELTVSYIEDQGGRPTVTRADADIPSGHAEAAFDADSAAARLLRSIVSTSALGPRLELEIERYARSAQAGWWRRAEFELEYDIVTVRAGGLSRSFQEITLRTLRQGHPGTERLSRAMSEQFGLRTLTIDRRERGEQLQTALESESLARDVASGHWVVIAALDGRTVATLSDAGGTIRLPASEGSGEQACRLLMRRVLGSSVGELHLLGTTPEKGRLRSQELWLCTRVDRSATAGSSDTLAWVPIDELLARVGTPAITDPGTLATLTLLARSELLPRLLSLPSARGVERSSAERTTEERKARPRPSSSGGAHAEGPLLDGDASLLAFNSRVLALAEDDTVPLLERLRYLAIVGANLDEFFSVAVGRIKSEGAEPDEETGPGGPAHRLTMVARRVRALIDREHVCEVACLRLLEVQGVHIRTPGDLTDAERAHLQTYFRSTVFPYLTPRAITATPGHSLPIVADRALAFAVALREEQSNRPVHLAELTVPPALPRFVSLPGSADVISLEDVIRLSLPLAYPGRRVTAAYLFRITRDAELGVDEQRAGNLTQAIDEHARRRRHQPIVRLEVERAMPASTRELLMRELQLEPGARPGSLGADDIYEIPGLLEYQGLRQLADLELPGLAFPPFRARRAVPEHRSLWDAIREQDIFLHHPYDEFATSVVRFFNDAADDPEVPSIKVALYRAGERSPIIDALRRAAEAGKDVTVFVELKARFDEQRNVRWTKQLEAAGAHVVQGLPGYKNHSKIALVVRRESDGPRRYAHIGTGNYNASTARFYTDFGVLTVRDAICDDLTDLFNTLTGSSVPTDVAYRECLVSPHALLPGLIARIEREAAHARTGKTARIRMKMNGLSDKEVIRALYGAAQDGVAIDLVVRGICTLAPGLAGISDRIRVVSVLGRFLEHARVYAFANDGAPEYFIGSADLRPRNLRRRVELLVPIHSAEHRARLDEILDLELEDPTAWTLGPDGTYVRRTGALADGNGTRGAQGHFAAAAEASHVAAT